ncbi:MAG TPA: WxcM-like domain-containing protein [Bacteroidales bacterium]|jgi:hypothetical protein|nr:WxcM-like domain-containing protein [Bacteroidales bacterium]
MEKLLELPKILDARGNLTFMENQRHFPFVIERVYWTYDVPGGEIRGGHAFKTHQEVVVALSGSFDVVVKDPDGSERRYHLNRSYKGLYLPPLTWRHMENFSTNALSLHLNSGAYTEDEYLRNYDDFCQRV